MAGLARVRHAAPAGQGVAVMAVMIMISGDGAFRLFNRVHWVQGLDSTVIGPSDRACSLLLLLC